MNSLYEWIHDDITWCMNECSYTECERNIANRLIKEGLFSGAFFRGTNTCPHKEEFQHENKETWKFKTK